MPYAHGDRRLEQGRTVKRYIPFGWPPMQVGDVMVEEGYLWVVTEASGPTLPDADTRMEWALRSADRVETFSIVPVGEAVER